MATKPKAKTQEQSGEMTDAQVREAEDKVLYPAAFHTHTMRIKDQDVELRPLVIKHAKGLGAKCDPALQDLARVREGDLNMSFMPKIMDGLIEALSYMGQIYGVPGVTKEWCEETMLDTEVTEILEVQLALMGNNSFLLSSLRNCLNVAEKTTEAGRENIAEAVVARIRSILSEAKDLPSTPSARPGTSASTSSSAATPEAS